MAPLDYYQCLSMEIDSTDDFAAMAIYNDKIYIAWSGPDIRVYDFELTDYIIQQYYYVEPEAEMPDDPEFWHYIHDYKGLFFNTSSGTAYMAAIEDYAFDGLYAQTHYINGVLCLNRGDVSTVYGIAYAHSLLFVPDPDTSVLCIKDSYWHSCGIVSQEGSGLDSFMHPHGVCVIGDYIYIADTDNNRISIWKITDYTNHIFSPTFNAIDLTQYSNDSAPRAVYSLSNRLYVACSTHVFVFDIGDDGVTGTLKNSADITDQIANSVCNYGNAIVATDDYIYVRVHETGTHNYQHVLVYENGSSVSPAQFDQTIESSDITLTSGQSGLTQNIPVNSSVSSNGALANLLFSLKGFVNSGELDKEFSFDLQIYTNNADISTDAFSVEGVLREVQDSTLDESIEAFTLLVTSNLFDESIGSESISLIAATTIFADSTLELDDFLTLTANQAAEATLTGSLILDEFNLTTVCGAQGRVAWLDLSFSGWAHVLGKAVGDVSLFDLGLLASGRNGNIAYGALVLDDFLIGSGLHLNYRASGALIVGIEIEGSLSNYRTTGEIELFDLTLGASLIAPSVKAIALFFDTINLNALMVNPIPSILLNQSNAIAYNYRRNAVTEYDTFPYSEIASDGKNFFVTDGTNICLLNENVFNSLEGRFKIGNIDIDLPRVRNYIDLILSGDLTDGTVTVTTETDEYTYPISTVRVPGEKRAVFGRGLIGRLKTIEFKSKSYFELDRIRLIVRETKRLR